MLEKLDRLDKNLLLFFNSYHNSFIDPLMYWISKTEFWIPLFILLIYLIYKKFKKKTVLILCAIGLSILFSDQIASSVFKPYFKRFRPCHEVSIAAQVHTYNGCGGKYGFVSSHAANTFAVATLICLFLYNTNKRIILLFLWAITVSFSRIYLGRHYPGDVIAGALLGIIIAFLLFEASKLLENKAIFKKAVTKE